MALVMTQDGRPFYVPDFLAPQAANPDVGTPDVQSVMAEYPNVGSTIAGMLPPPAPPPPPPPPPPKQNLGPTGPSGGQEVAAPIAPPGLASVTGGQLPTNQLGPNGQAQPQSDYKAGTVDNSPAAIAASNAQFTHAEKQREQNASIMATPEGQAQLAGAEGQAAVGDQVSAAQSASSAEAAQADAASGAQQEGLARVDKLREQGAKDLEARQKGITEKTIAYDSAVQAEANYKIDDNRRWKDLGTGQKIGLAIMMGLSSIGDALMHKQGGVNPVFKMLEDAIQGDVAAQARDADRLGKRIGTARNSLDAYRQLTGDAMDAQKLKLSEEYERTAKDVEASMGKYQSPIVKARGEQMAAQLREKGAAIRGQTAESAFNRDQKRQDQANERSRIGLAYAGFNEGRRQFNVSQDERVREFDLTNKREEKQLYLAAQKELAAGNAAQAKLIREQAVAAPMKPKLDANGKPVIEIGPNGLPQIAMESGGELMQAGGKERWIIPTPDEAKKFREEKGAADAIISLQDEMRSIRDRVGGESSWANSDDYQRLQVIQQNLIMLKKQGTQGMSSDADMERMEKALGADSPASFRAQMAKMDEARAITVRTINQRARDLGYTGKALDYPDPLKAAKPEESAKSKDARGYEGSKTVQQVDSFLPKMKDLQERLWSPDRDISGAAATELADIRDKARDSQLSDLAANVIFGRLYNERVPDSGFKAVDWSKLPALAR